MSGITIGSVLINSAVNGVCPHMKVDARQAKAVSHRHNCSSGVGAAGNWAGRFKAQHFMKSRVFVGKG